MTINYWAVLVSAVVSIIIGSVWYGPLFGKMFMRAKGMDKMSKQEQSAMRKGMTLTYIAQFLASLVTFWVLAWVIVLANTLGASGGITVALFMWFGFVLPLALGDALWGGKMTLFWLASGNMFLTFLAAGAIIGAWR
jgi:hypothetical protein